MRTKMALLIFVMTAAGIFTLACTKNTPPPDLRDALADFTDIRASDIKTGSGADIPMPAPAARRKSASKKEEAATYALISVDEQIPAKTADGIKTALNAAAKKINALNPGISITFSYNHYIPINPQVVFFSPVSRRIIYLHEAKELRYEWAPALKKPTLFLGRKAHPDTMNIREQVEAVLDCAAFLSDIMSENK
jgi:hypothetical protein